MHQAYEFSPIISHTACRRICLPAAELQPAYIRISVQYIAYIQDHRKLWTQ